MTVAASMDLLDRFAIAALPKLIPYWQDLNDDETKRIAVRAYEIARAMLRQHYAVAEQVRAEAMRPAAPTT